MHFPALPTRRQLLHTLGAAGLAPWAGLAGAEPAMEWPAPGRWRYRVTGQIRGVPYRAQAQLDWQHAAGRYQAELGMSMWLLGERHQRSTGTLGPGGLQPEHFVDKARQTRELRMDWIGQRFQPTGQGPALPLPPGAQDRLSLFFQLAGLLSRNAAAPRPGQAWQLPVLGRSGSEDWTFVAAGAERLTLPVGPLTAWKLERRPLMANDLRSELWFAPEWQQLPVRIRLTEPNGDVVDQQLAERLPAP
jgi:hypothetical protein